MEQKFEFSENWNLKLFNHFFTTLRLNDTFEVGGKYPFWVKVKNQYLYLGEVEVMVKKQFLLSHINDSLAYLDTGYNAEMTRNIIKTMYKNHAIDFEKKPITWYVLRVTERVSYPPLPEIKSLIKKMA